MSLMVRSALLGFIPYVMQATDIVCQWGHTCMLVNVSELEVLVEAVVAAVFYVLTLVSAIGVLWGAARKVWLTFTGQNQVLK